MFYCMPPFLTLEMQFKISGTLNFSTPYSTGWGNGKNPRLPTHALPIQPCCFPNRVGLPYSWKQTEVFCQGQEKRQWAVSVPKQCWVCFPTSFLWGCWAFLAAWLGGDPQSTCHRKLFVFCLNRGQREAREEVDRLPGAGLHHWNTWWKRVNSSPDGNGAFRRWFTKNNCDFFSGLDQCPYGDFMLLGSYMAWSKITFKESVLQKQFLKVH